MDIRKHITLIVFLLHLPILAYMLAVLRNSFMPLDESGMWFIAIVSLIMGVTMPVMHWIIGLAMEELFPSHEMIVVHAEQHPAQAVWTDTFVHQAGPGAVSFKPVKQRAYVHYYGA